MQKLSSVLIFCIFILTSCQDKGKESAEIESIVKTYVNYLSEIDVLKESMIIKVTIDSSSQLYQGVRITTYPYLLNYYELPNDINQYKGAKIAFFTDNLEDQIEIDRMVSNLEEKGFYQEGSTIGLLSNYPEWVVLRKDNHRKPIIVKDQWYKPLSEIISDLEDK